MRRAGAFLIFFAKKTQNIVFLQAVYTISQNFPVFFIKN